MQIWIDYQRPDRNIIQHVYNFCYRVDVTRKMLRAVFTDEDTLEIKAPI